MDIEEGLKLAEQLLKRDLNELEVLIFQESWKDRGEGKKYKEIADTYRCSPGQVNDTASDLWKLLSQALGKKVLKNTFRRELEKQLRSHSAAVPPPQEQAQEETPSKNTDFVGREEAIAASTSEEDLVRKVCSSRQVWENLLDQHIIEPNYRRLFLLTIERVPSSDKIYWLQAMKQRVDKIADEPYLQDFLSWVSLKSKKASTSYKSAVIRAFYIQFAPQSSPAFVDLASNLAGTGTFNFEARLSIDVFLLRTLHSAFEVGNLYFNVGDLQPLIFEESAKIRIKDFHEVNNNLHQACTNAHEFDFALQQLLQKLINQLPELDDEEIAMKWWKDKGQTWAEELREVMIKHCDIGHNWQFSSQQKGLLKEYYEANKLLVDCLNSASEETRAHIEDSLLLPIAEIKQRTPQA